MGCVNRCTLLSSKPVQRLHSRVCLMLSHILFKWWDHSHIYTHTLSLECRFIFRWGWTVYNKFALDFERWRGRSTFKAALVCKLSWDKIYILADLQFVGKKSKLHYIIQKSLPCKLNFLTYCGECYHRRRTSEMVTIMYTCTQWSEAQIVFLALLLFDRALPRIYANICAIMYATTLLSWWSCCSTGNAHSGGVLIVK